ncbi:MAG: hypothetical protein LIO90_03510 [Bacteroidales bacterium]|nr:hypothetical protein [Bacteroidales bacterium]
MMVAQQELFHIANFSTKLTLFHDKINTSKQNCGKIVAVLSKNCCKVAAVFTKSCGKLAAMWLKYVVFSLASRYTSYWKLGKRGCVKNSAIAKARDSLM